VNARFTFWLVDGIPVRVDEAQPALFDEAFDLLALPRLVPAGHAKQYGKQVSEAEWWTLVSHLRGRYRPDVAGTRYSFWAYKEHLPIRYDTVSGSAEAFHDWPPVPLRRLPLWSPLVRVSEAEFWARTARARGLRLLHSTAEIE
jgi:hypothetical protein